MSKEKERKTFRIFVTHSMQDKAIANALIKQLSLHPKVHIFTPHDVSAGEYWQTIIRRELSRSDVFVVVLSPNSVNSAWVLSELGAAWGLGKPIISVVTEPDVMSRLPMNLDDAPVVRIEDIQNSDTLKQLIERYRLAA